MSASQRGSFRYLLEQFTEPQNVFAPPGVTPESLVALTMALEQRGKSLPRDYASFLQDSNGLLWNGIQMFGLPGSCPVSPLDILNAKFLLDPTNRIPPVKLLIGTCESFLYVHNPVIAKYERYYKGVYALDSETYRDFSGMLVKLFAERQAGPRVLRPVISTLLH